MKCDDLIDMIIGFLSAHSDESRIEFASKNYPTNMKVLGVVSRHEKETIDLIKQKTTSFSTREKINFAKVLCETNIFECQHIAFEWIGKDKKMMAELEEKDIEFFDQDLDNWVSVDSYSGYLLGPLWNRGVIKTNKIKSFLNSKNVWRRRIAVVATVALNQKARGGNGDPERTLEICSMVLDDHHDKMIKALSWALRELAKRKKEPVAAFIKLHEKTLHPRVLREVKNKLNTGKKN